MVPARAPPPTLPTGQRSGSCRGVHLVAQQHQCHQLDYLLSPGSVMPLSQAKNVGDAASRAGAATGRAVEAAGQKVITS